jgi:hypothetical protein
MKKIKTSLLVLIFAFVPALLSADGDGCMVKYCDCPNLDFCMSCYGFENCFGSFGICPFCNEPEAYVSCDAIVTWCCNATYIGGGPGPD